MIDTYKEVKRIKMRLSIILTLLFLFFYASAIYADTPLPPPVRYEVESSSHKYVATVDPKTGVEVRATDSLKILWKSNVWSRIAFLADDGEHFITGYSGVNLIPQDYTKDLVLVTFWQRDVKIREVTVGELFPDTRTLKETVSHYYWGDIMGITNNALIVARCDGKVIKFDVTTGRVTK